MNDLSQLLDNTEIHILDCFEDIYPFIWKTSDKPKNYSKLDVDLIVNKIVDKISTIIDKSTIPPTVPPEEYEETVANEICNAFRKILSYYSDIIDEMQLISEIKQVISAGQLTEKRIINGLTVKWVYKILINITLNHISEEDLTQILSLTGFPISIVFERYYCDKIYRDSYYNYFSRMFRNINRNCHRLSFFSGKNNFNAFYNTESDEIESKLQKDFIGVLILTPSFDMNNQTSIGRVYFDPYKISIPHCYIRTTKFKFCILGRKFEIDAYPFIRQNLVSMSCSESVLWNILEYFGNRYSDYRRILPSDIIKCLDEQNEERLIPSSGLDINSMEAALKKFGFEPKLYAKEQYGYKLKKFFHRYIESAVIVAMELDVSENSPSDESTDQIHYSSSEGHSVVCIGHTEKKNKLNLIKANNIVDKIPDGESNDPFFVIDSSHFYSDYVIIDDNQMPYVINTYDHFSTDKNMKLIGFTAPIYKHVNLDAVDVELVVKTFLDAAGGSRLIKDLFNNNHISANSETNPLVLRFFLTTSRNFKKHRFSSSASLNEKIFYANIIYPKMIWVCELIDYNAYLANNTSNKCVLGEIVIDSTAVQSELMNSIISLRICNFISFRMPDDTYETIRKDLTDSKGIKHYSDYGFTFPYEMYSNNNLKSNKKKGGSLKNGNC